MGLCLIIPKLSEFSKNNSFATCLCMKVTEKLSFKSFFGINFFRSADNDAFHNDVADCHTSNPFF